MGSTEVSGRITAKENGGPTDRLLFEREALGSYAGLSEGEGLEVKGFPSCRSCKVQAGEIRAGIIRLLTDVGGLDNLPLQHSPIRCGPTFAGRVNQRRGETNCP